MPAWCLICAALLACLSPAPPTKSLDLSLTLTNNVIHVNDVPEHLLTMYPVCTLPCDRRCPPVEDPSRAASAIQVVSRATPVAQERGPYRALSARPRTGADRNRRSRLEECAGSNNWIQS
jgi:hypothetical protein